MPTSDRVVVRLEHGSTEPGPTRTLTLYDDGSLVDDESWPPTVRALTPAGRDLVVGRVRDTGSFTKSHTIPAIPVEHGFGFFGVTLVVGTPITVGFSNVTCGTEGSPVGCKDDPEHGVLLALVDALSDVASWLPASAFRDGDLRPHPYLAAKTRVTSERILLRPDDWTNPEQSLGLIDWPLEILPSELGRPVQLADEPERALRCELIDGARERTLRAALARLSSQTTEADPRTTIWDVWMDGPALIRLTLRPYLPDEVGGCQDTGLPAAPSLGGAPRPTLAAVLAASDGGIAPPQPTAILYARVSSTADEGAGRSVSYYADGTVLFRDPSPPAIGMGALWLTPAGLDLLRRTLDDSGLLASDYDESIPEGAVYAHMTTILTPDVVLNASDRGRVAKATAIAKLAGKLIDPAAWLPATAWMTAPTRLLPFRPAALQLRIEPTTVPTDRVLPPVTALDSSLQSIGRADPDMPGARLATVSTGDAIAFITALEATGAPRSGGPTSVEYLLAANVPGGALKINLWVDINELSR